MFMIIILKLQIRFKNKSVLFRELGLLSAPEEGLLSLNRVLDLVGDDARLHLASAERLGLP